MRKILNVLSTILVILALLVAFLSVGVKIFGLELYVVLSPSMEPTFSTGSVVYVKAVDPTEVQVGDVITFHLDENTLATHRVIEVLQNGSSPSFRTKGDANNVPDSRPVKSSALVGKVLFAVPKMGALVEFIHTPDGTKVAIAVGVGLVLLVALPDLLFPKQKKEKKQDEASPEQVEPTAPGETWSEPACCAENPPAGPACGAEVSPDEPACCADDLPAQTPIDSEPPIDQPPA